MASHSHRVCNMNRNRFLSLIPASLSKLILNTTPLGGLPAAPSTRPPMTCDHLSCCVAFSLAAAPAHAHSYTRLLQAGGSSAVTSPGLATEQWDGVAWGCSDPKNQLCGSHTAWLPQDRCYSEGITHEPFLGAIRCWKGCSLNQEIIKCKGLHCAVLGAQTSKVVREYHQPQVITSPKW